MGEEQEYHYVMDKKGRLIKVDGPEPLPNVKVNEPFSLILKSSGGLLATITWPYVNDFLLKRLQRLEKIATAKPQYEKQRLIIKLRPAVLNCFVNLCSYGFHYAFEYVMTDECEFDYLFPSLRKHDYYKDEHYQNLKNEFDSKMKNILKNYEARAHYISNNYSFFGQGIERDKLNSDYEYAKADLIFYILNRTWTTPDQQPPESKADPKPCKIVRG